MAIVILALHTAPGAQEDLQGRRATTASPRSAWDWTISGWGSSSTRPAPSSPSTTPGSPTRSITYGHGPDPVNVFDPRAEWLIDHQNARPYASEGADILGGEEAAPVAGADAVPIAGGGRGGQAGRGGPPGGAAPPP